MGVLRCIKGGLTISTLSMQHKIKTLSPLVFVGGNMFLRNTRLSLGTLKEVVGDLNLRRNAIADLGELEHVGGNFLYSKYNESQFSNSLDRVRVDGEVKRFNDGYRLRFDDDNWLDNILTDI